MNLQILEQKPLKFGFKLFGREQETALASGELKEDEKTDLRKLGLQMANTFIKNSLGFRGIAQSRIAYTSQKKNGRKNIMLSSYDGTHQQRFSYNWFQQLRQLGLWQSEFTLHDFYTFQSSGRDPTLQKT